MRLNDVVRLMRPRQWTKNLAVYAGIIFSGNLFNMSPLKHVTVGFVSMCLVSSALYALNDVLDARRDREHPTKRERPVASGAISRPLALLISAVLIAIGLVLALLLPLPFLYCLLGYSALQLLYAFWLKHVAIVDMLAISAGFVVRAIAGAAAIDVDVSPWLVLCAGLLALFLAAAKRRHELVLLRDRSHEHRPALSGYTAELLDSFMVTLSAATVSSYALYTFFEGRAPHYLMMLTIPFVIYGILRYQHLVLAHGGGGTPEEVLLTDMPILLDAALWALTSVLLLYVF